MGATLRFVYTFAVGPIGGNNWTVISTAVLAIPAVGALGVIYFLNLNQFAGFLGAFLVLFLAFGIGSGSTFQMIPTIFIPKEAAPVIGFSAAFAAYGSYLIPKLFGWSVDTTGSYVTAFYFFIGFYVIAFFTKLFLLSKKNNRGQAIG